MSFSSRLLASGPGWRVRDCICTAGPQNRPFEERHEAVCVAAVTRGTFHYRAAQGRSTLVPGALLLGNPGTHFECSHEHGVGDRCLSFDFDPDYFEGSSPRLRALGASSLRCPAFHLRRRCFRSSQPPRRPMTISDLRKLRCALPALPLRQRTGRVRRSATYDRSVGSPRSFDGSKRSRTRR